MLNESAVILCVKIISDLQRDKPHIIGSSAQTQ